MHAPLSRCLGSLRSLAQHAVQNFSGRVSWHLVGVNQANVAWHLVSRQSLGAPRGQVVCSGVAPFVQHHKGVHGFAPFFMGYTDDGYIAN